MKKVFNLIIVDESGSMSIIEKQALMGLNETLETVKKIQQAHPEMEQRVTLLTFDSTHKRFIFNNVPANDTHTLSKKDYRPGGATPLYDTIGIGISKLNAQTEPDDNVLVTIITDGEENCSEEYNLKMVKNLIEKLKKQSWTFTLIGTDNLDVEGMAGSLAIDDHMAFPEDAKGTKRMFMEGNMARCNFNVCLAEGRPMPRGHFFKNKKGKKE